jgi:hypothetical protein
MSDVIEVSATGATLGPFRVYPGRPFGAWFEVTALQGATSVTLTTEISEDAQTWTTAETKPALVSNDRYAVYVLEPQRYARLVVSVTAPGGWTGTVRCAYDAAKAAWDEAIVDAAAQQEAARVAAALADIRQRLGIGATPAVGRSPHTFLPTRQGGT